ncbi:MAG TPA: hypothetical protein VHA14_18520, partial [Bryobacteraceae bacterium]|nr:hypothetical protein [Bryobacteraceae bacterium]
QVVLDIRVPPPPQRAPGDGYGPLPAPAEYPALPGPNEDFVGEALYRAMSRAGLKLERTKAPVDMIVVDQLAKQPTPN